MAERKATRKCAACGGGLALTAEPRLHYYHVAEGADHTPVLYTTEQRRANDLAASVPVTERGW